MRRDGNPVAAGMRVCSACDGNYEDPERTAWSDDEDEEADQASSEQAEQGAARERFPVRAE
jgi:ribosome-binding protein aMBF1 (putative translation factor)